MPDFAIWSFGLARAAVLVLTAGCAPAASSGVSLAIFGEAPVAITDARFLSVALDTSQLVGGRWWSPDAHVESGFGQTQLAPYDFTRSKLRALAAALSPAFLRVGGSQADLTYYDLGEGPLLVAPAGFDGVLTRAQWLAMVDFARASKFQVAFTLNAGAGPRDAKHQWQPDQARTLVEFAAARADPVEVWELGNEINGAQFVLGAAIDGRQYAADFAVARGLLDELAPKASLSGPSSAFWPLLGEVSPVLPEFLAKAGGLAGVVSWHYYPQESRRCPVHVRAAGPEVMLDDRALDDVIGWASALRTQTDALAPNAALWLGETGNAQCGGEPGVSDRFAGTLWWLDELGAMARAGHRVVVRQTLSGASYGLIDDATLEPRPDYFASVLWKQLMGARVLDVEVAPKKAVRAYAHCAQGGGVALLVINIGRPSVELHVPAGLRVGVVERWELSAEALDSAQLRLNGVALEVDATGQLPSLKGEVGVDAAQPVPGRSAVFLRFPQVQLAACEAL